MKLSINKILRTLQKFRHVGVVSITFFLLASIYGFYQACISSMIEAAFMLYGLGWAVYLPYETNSIFNLRESFKKSYFVALGFAFLSIISSGFGYISLGLTLLFIAPIVYFGKHLLLIAKISAVVIWTFAIPNVEYLHHFVSYPMRIVAAEISAWILSVCGFSAVAHATLINIDGIDIAVTSACSGIEQLEAMIFVGWIISLIMNRSFWIRILHFIFILPIIIFVNAMRLAFTLGGYSLYGDIFLSDTIHIILGVLTVILIALLYVLVGKILSIDAPEEVAK